MPKVPKDVNKRGFIVYVFFCLPLQRGQEKAGWLNFLKRFAVDGSAKSSRL